MARKPNPIVWMEDPETGCWECTSHPLNTSGYPRIGKNGKQYCVHRFLYEELFGPVPEGHVVRHKCDNRRCINPEHLELGTYKENSQDMVERKRVRGRYTTGYPEGIKREVVHIAQRDGIWKAVSRYHIQLAEIERWMKEFGEVPPRLKPRYPLAFKQEVVRYYQKHGFAKTEMMFGIPGTTFLKWTKQFGEGETQTKKQRTVKETAR